ncbi:RNA polymerase sigma factor [Fimbriiglobus ruber]|uniref:Putative Co/Zn/Cd efflux system membrane fusion protein n=1 Tax=Fimbriiglobus ruber TaxID=1908690 RepID=A0A225DGN2_9BACT|nr:sigma-70 family RNA polymerase sigma factor [Fimbriiglobus ruber]OWK40612.1 putative Co/Zn/Cd efflux system membrane fusion protein [Fimbriiglobus ruber]
MNRLHLQALLRTVADGTNGVSDVELLARYRHNRDDAAFTELVARYGRLVWSVCRHLTRSDADAEDAFQATFLALAQGADRVRKGDKLGAWLHGVAYRVCMKLRRAEQRRAARERAAAPREAASDVPESAWDRALAAVHEELAKLPDTLRVPFIVCCLEGKGTSAAAESLGWKLGTLSGRLTRAKDLLVARLEARGFAAGVVAAAAVTGGAASAPAAVTGRAVEAAAPGATISPSVLHLSHGVIGMSINRVKLLAAAVMLACGLGTGVGTMWVANAQPPTKSDEAAAAAAKYKQAVELYYRAAEKVAQPAKWEYRYKPLTGRGTTQSVFEKLVQENETDGFAFFAVINMEWSDQGGKLEPSADGKSPGTTLPTLAFRRALPPGQSAKSPPQGAKPEVRRIEGFKMLMEESRLKDRTAQGAKELEAAVEQLRATVNKLQMEKAKLEAQLKAVADPTLAQKKLELETLLEQTMKALGDPVQKQRLAAEQALRAQQEAKAAEEEAHRAKQEAKAAEEKALRSQLQEMRTQIEKLKAQPAPNKGIFKLEKGGKVQKTYTQPELPLGVSELKDVLGRLAAKRFGDRVTFQVSGEGATLVVSGDKEAIEWAGTVIQTMSGK